MACSKPINIHANNLYDFEFGDEIHKIKKRYIDLKVIGNGPRGIVLEGFDTISKQYIVIKHLSKPFSNENDVKRTYREFMVHLSINHKNVVKLLHAYTPVQSFSSFEDFYMVLETEEANLSQIIQTDLNGEHLSFMVYQMLCGVNYLHKIGIIHENLKPCNILVNSLCQIKITGFDIILNSQGHSETNPYLSKQSYKAPECIFGLEYNEKVDVWQIACIFGEVWIKRVLFPAMETIDHIRKIIDLLGSLSEEFLKGLSDPIRSFVENYSGKQEDSKNKFPDEIFEHCRSPISAENGRDLFSKMLVIDPTKRYSVDEALNHPFVSSFKARDKEYQESFDFYEVRKRIEIIKNKTPDEMPKLIYEKSKELETDEITEIIKSANLNFKTERDEEDDSNNIEKDPLEDELIHKIGDLKISSRNEGITGAEIGIKGPIQNMGPQYSDGQYQTNQSFTYTSDAFSSNSINYNCGQLYLQQNERSDGQPPSNGYKLCKHQTCFCNCDCQHIVETPEYVYHDPEFFMNTVCDCCSGCINSIQNDSQAINNASWMYSQSEVIKQRLDKEFYSDGKLYLQQNERSDGPWQGYKVCKHQNCCCSCYHVHENKKIDNSEELKFQCYCCSECIQHQLDNRANCSECIRKRLNNEISSDESNRSSLTQMLNIIQNQDYSTTDVQQYYSNSVAYYHPDNLNFRRSYLSEKSSNRDSIISFQTDYDSFDGQYSDMAISNEISSKSSSGASINITYLTEATRPSKSRKDKPMLNLRKVCKHSRNSKKDKNISDAVMQYLGDRTDEQLLELLVSMLDEASEKGINLDTIKRIRERSNEKGYRQRRSQKIDDLKQEIPILEQTKEELHEKCQRLEQEMIPLRTEIFTSHPNNCECNNFIKSTEFLNF